MHVLDYSVLNSSGSNGSSGSSGNSGSNGSSGSNGGSSREVGNLCKKGSRGNWKRLRSHKLVPAPIPLWKCSRCNEWMNPALTTDHFVNKCSHRNTVCEMCHEEMWLSNYANHQNYICPEKDITCECGISMKLKDKYLHPCFLNEFVKKCQNDIEKLTEENKRFKRHVRRLEHNGV